MTKWLVAMIVPSARHACRIRSVTALVVATGITSTTHASGSYGDGPQSPGDERDRDLATGVGASPRRHLHPPRLSTSIWLRDDDLAADHAPGCLRTERVVAGDSPVAVPPAEATRRNPASEHRL
jgi:hypothetical protein